MEEEVFSIENEINEDDVWAGLGGHFESLGQVINEFIDNSISNFIANETELRNIIITLKELNDDNVQVSIEDTGTGILDLNAAFSMGARDAAETPMNEHGFGIKHALAAANPTNDSWRICTRNIDDFNNMRYREISAKYKFMQFKGRVIDSQWPGKNSGTGTIVEFKSSREFFKTIGLGIKGGVTNFSSICDVLCEDLGFIYSGIIKSNKANISLVVDPLNGDKHSYPVGSVIPDWEKFIEPSQGSSEVNLGNGHIIIEYSFGVINDKSNREPFNNDTTRKYYKRSMSSSGVEIRLNGRVLEHNLFKEIWNIEKHNSYNSLLITLNLKSDDIKKLPETTTSKNGLRQGDKKLEKLYEWIRQQMPEPVKNVSLGTDERDRFQDLAKELNKRYKNANLDPFKVEVEMHVFKSLGNKDMQRADMYEAVNNKVTVYEGKKGSTTSKDVYQLRMYWDGLVYDGIKPNLGRLVGDDHPETVKTLVNVVNNMKDANGNKYNFELKEWKDL